MPDVDIATRYAATISSAAHRADRRHAHAARTALLSARAADADADADAREVAARSKYATRSSPEVSGRRPIEALQLPFRRHSVAIPFLGHP